MSTQPSPEFSELVDRIKKSALTVWPGEGRTFDVRIIHSSDGPSVSAVLVEGGAAKGTPRTMSGFYATEKEALEDVERQLGYMVEEQSLLA
jgi:hypothetical protein